MRTFLALAVLAVLVGCGSEPPAAEGEPEPVYRLTPAELPLGDCDDPSCTPVRYVAWVAPGPGWVRTEYEDGTGFETTLIFAHGALVTDHNDGPPDVRSGLATFVGEPVELELVEAVRARGTLAVDDRIHVRLGAAPLTYVVDEKLPLENASARELFEIPQGGIQNRTLEPGVPSGAVAAYWLGPRFGDREAVAAVERDAPVEDGYFVFYELPSAGGAASFVPGAHAPEGELQITSQPIDAPLSRRTLAQLADHEQIAVTLADGERARLIPGSPGDESYAVATRTTLVGFSAASDAEALAIAAALRPVAP